MRAPPVFFAALVALVSGCEGPILDIAQPRLFELDASELQDGRVGDAQRPARDAERDTRDPVCREHKDCNDNFPRYRCHPAGVCVECVRDGDCFSGRCNEGAGECRDKPHP